MVIALSKQLENVYTNDFTELHLCKIQILAIRIDCFVIHQSQSVIFFLEFVQYFIHGVQGIFINLAPHPVVGVLFTFGGLSAFYENLAAVPPVHGCLQVPFFSRHPHGFSVVPPVRMRRIRMKSHQEEIVVVCIVHVVLYNSVALWIKT